MRKSVVIGIGILLAGATVWAQQYMITTVAGNGGADYPTLPVTSLAADAAGNVYFSVQNSVFKVDAMGVRTLMATDSQLYNPSGLAVDAAGNIYVAERDNNAIRKVGPTGIITTVTGNGWGGYSGDGGPAINAQVAAPTGVAVDAAGNLYISDFGNGRIRKVAAETGIITTVAGNGGGGSLGDGGPATSAEFFGNWGVAVDAAGNLYIGDGIPPSDDVRPNGVIRKVAAATGTITSVVGSGTAPIRAAFRNMETVAVDASGNLYIADGYAILKVAAATGVVTTVPGQFVAKGAAVAADGSGNLYIADGLGGRILKVAAATGIITTVAGHGTPVYSGDGGAATSTRISVASGVALDGTGNLYIADPSDGRVLMVAAATGIITTLAGNGTDGYSGDGGPATSAQLDWPSGVAVDGLGNVYIADGSSCIRQVAAATGIITTVAGNGTYGYSGDGGPATSAQLYWPGGVAVDGFGNLYIADEGNHVIRKVAATTGIITTVAGNGTAGYSGDGSLATSANLAGPWGVAVDHFGNLYIADGLDHVIRKVMAATGIITTVAGNGTFGYLGDGGPATSAQFYFPSGVAVDGPGNVYIADEYNQVIRKVAAATGIITTVAGLLNYGEYSGDGGPATSAHLYYPGGVAVDGAGKVYLADSGNGVIRMLVPDASQALLSIASTHSATFARGQMGALYSVVVSNAAGSAPTSGTVTVTEIVPTGLTLVSMSGSGWDCSGATCVRSDVLSAGASYPPITVTVDVAEDAPSLVTNQVTVSGGASRTVAATDLTEIGGPPTVPVLMSPANGVTGALVAPTLVWGASGGTLSYDVYFGVSSSPPMVVNTPGTSYSPGTLISGETYYWRIVARNGSWASSSETWSFTTGVPATGSRFVPVAPCRVADTRNPLGLFGGPRIAARSVRSFAIPQSGCGIPATAQAYSLEVTVVPDGRLSYLTMWPTGQSQPLVSTLNSWGGIVVANAAIVPAGSGGAVDIFATEATDVILDINGYFDATPGASSYSFHTVSPCRVTDTREPTDEFGGPSMFAGQTRGFPIPLGPCGTPAAANAYSLNVTAVPETDYLGYLTTWPTGQLQPVVSTLTSWTGRVVANAAIVPVGTNGSISVFVTDPTDVILDINGYFGQPGGAGELSFYPVTPCRVVDTRGAVGAFGGPEMEARSVRSFALPAGNCSVPSNAAAYSLNVTVVPNGVLPFLTAWPTGVGQPLVSTLNSFDGSVVANAAIVPAGTNGAVSIYVAGRTQVILDINGYFAP